MALSYAVYALFCAFLALAIFISTPRVSRLELIAKGRRGIDIVEKRTKSLLERLNANRTKKKYDKEMYEEIGFLRNISMSPRSDVTTTDMLIEKLIEHGGTLRPIFVKTLSLLRMDRKKQAIDLFTREVGTPMSCDFIRIVVEWDEIPPSRLTSSLLSYQKNMQEMRMTEQKKQDEVVSDIIYFPVVVNVLVIFMNFIYIAYFLEQKAMFQTIFF